MNAPKFTIAICTYNRGDALKVTLDSLLDMSVSQDLSWELIIVDNRSTDHTKQIVDAYIKRAPFPVLYAYEERQGLSNARNNAVMEASGDYLIFTDDDVRVDRMWLMAYAEAARNWPDAAVFGGKIIPVFENGPPKWLRRSKGVVDNSFAARDLGNEPRELVPESRDNPFGANMMVRMREQKKYLYDPELGAGSRQGLYGEESLVLMQIRSAGGSGRWVPDAIVYHLIPASRQTKDFLWQYYACYGRTCVYQNPDDVFNVQTIFGVPRWLMKDLLISHCRHYWHRLFSPPDKWCDTLSKAAISRGSMQQWWRMRKIKAHQN